MEHFSWISGVLSLSRLDCLDVSMTMNGRKKGEGIAVLYCL